jgi:chlorobactene glucosyltransferase
MMTMLAVAAAAALALMLGVAVYNVRTAPRLARYDSRSRTSVSVLIPARNEERNLWRTLPALLSSDWSRLEIIVLDDGSSDRTAAVAAAFAAVHPHRLRVLRGRPAPAGWLGKNWACHQLAEHARGDVLIFCDADMKVSRRAVRRTVAALEVERADVLTGLPRQQLERVIPRAVIPIVMQLSIGAALPLARVPSSHAASLAVGNGQWLACTRTAYRRIGGHATVRQHIAEDISIARAAKRHGLRLFPVIATQDLSVRMYEDAPQVWAGFRKNLYAIAGGSPVGFALVFAGYMLTMLVPFVLPFLGALPVALAVLPLVLLGGVRLAVARLFEHGAAPMLLHLPGAAVVAGIALASAWGSWRGTLVWKGRSLQTRLVQGIEP